MNFNKLKKCFIIAEVSANHGQDFDRAVSLVKEAKKCGADAVKFQCYKPDTLTIDCDSEYFKIKHSKWKGQTLYELYKKSYIRWEWLGDLKKIADDLGILFFATAFDKTAVDYLEELEVPIHKISSFELIDLPLIKYASKTRKPIIISTGMGSISEITDAANAAQEAGAKNVILLKCVSSYPAQSQDMNLRTILDMEKRFKCPVGLSDHTLGIGTSITAVALGAKVIEKHFTLSREIETSDSFFSIEPNELKELVNNIRTVEKSLGKIHYGLTDKERQSKAFRRSLFVIKDLKKSEKITKENIRSIRPSQGLEPKYLEEILGKTARENIKKGTPLSCNMVEDWQKK